VRGWSRIAGPRPRRRERHQTSSSSALWAEDAHGGGRGLALLHGMDAGRDGDRLGDGWLARGRRRPEAEAARCGGGGGCVGGTLLFCFYHGGRMTSSGARVSGAGFRFHHEFTTIWYSWASAQLSPCGTTKRTTKILTYWILGRIRNKFILFK
jgi:hypothetical protein